MFPKQRLIAFIHAFTIASAPFSSIIGLVLFGMLTASPKPKPPETLQELLPAAERKSFKGEFAEALVLYDKAKAQLPRTSVVMIDIHWGKGATYFRQFTIANSRVRSLRIKSRSDSSLRDDYQKAKSKATMLFNQGVGEFLETAKIAETIGRRECGQNIRAILPRLEKGMVRYNNPYSFYLNNATTGC
jgi:hypothetical protein